MEPEVTIVIPVRNGADFIGEAIESVLEQTFTNWILLVRDNLSKDQTCDVVSRYLSDPRIRLIKGGSDLSMAGSYNACLGLVQTKYYTLLSHDDYFYKKHALETGYKLMEANPSLPTVYCDLIYVDKRRATLATRRFGRSGLIEWSTLARQSILRARNLFGIPVLARASTLQGVRCDERLPYIIDLDISIGMAKGQAIYHVPEILIANRYHGSNNTGLLLKGVGRQFLALGPRHGVPLSSFDHVRANLSAAYMRIAKTAFLIYARNKRPPTNANTTSTPGA